MPLDGMLFLGESCPKSQTSVPGYRESTNRFWGDSVAALVFFWR